MKLNYFFEQQDHVSPFEEDGSTLQQQFAQKYKALVYMLTRMYRITVKCIELTQNQFTVYNKSVTSVDDLGLAPDGDIIVPTMYPFTKVQDLNDSTLYTSTQLYSSLKTMTIDKGLELVNSKASVHLNDLLHLTNTYKRLYHTAKKFSEEILQLGDQAAAEYFAGKDLTKNLKVATSALPNLKVYLKKHAIAAATDASVAATNHAIEPANVPKYITMGKAKITVQYWYDENGRYAGSVEHYPFSSVRRQQLADIQDVLQKAGMAPLVRMYSCIRTHASERDTLVFTCINADHTFVWQAHGVGQGAMNMVYNRRGEKQNLSSLLASNVSDSQREKWLK